MKNIITQNKKIAVYVMLISLMVLITLIVFYLQLPQVRARKVLLEVYTFSLADSTNLRSIVEAGDDKLILDYIDNRYENLFTSNGATQAVKNRIVSRAIEPSLQSNENYKAQSIKVTPRTNQAGIEFFDYHVISISQTNKNNKINATGTITMTKENNIWKTDAISIDTYLLNHK